MAFWYSALPEFNSLLTEIINMISVSMQLDYRDRFFHSIPCDINGRSFMVHIVLLNAARQRLTNYRHNINQTTRGWICLYSQWFCVCFDRRAYRLRSISKFRARCRRILGSCVTVSTSLKESNGIWYGMLSVGWMAHNRRTSELHTPWGHMGIWIERLWNVEKTHVCCEQCRAFFFFSATQYAVSVQRYQPTFCHFYTGYSFVILSTGP